MKLWHLFRHSIEKNIISLDDDIKGLPYWRNKLFANILLYLLPISFIALVPGVIMSFIGKIPLLAFFDMITVFLFAIVALYPGFTLLFRKLFLIAVLYLLSIVLLVFLGSFGPGLLYLLALTVFIALVFPIDISIWSIFANLLICVVFAVVIEYKLIAVPVTNLYSIGSWIAVSSNLILLSAVIVVSLNLLFGGLQSTIEKEAALQQQLREEGQKLEKMLQNMEAKNEELEQFAYIASHDLQEPLKTITSVVEVLERQYKGRLEGNAVKYLDFLSESATRMHALIHGLLEYSRLGKEKQTDLVNCNQIIDEILKDFSSTISETGATFSIDKLPEVKAYKSEIKQLFQNLISNALKFHREDISPIITISSEEVKNQYIFFVKDNGIGIDEKFRNKIFVIFQRLHTRSKYEGTGIGLAQCKKIVALHGGKLWVESTPEKGSTFYFTILKVS